MTNEQRAAALRLADRLESCVLQRDMEWMLQLEAADLLRALAAEPVAEPVAWAFLHSDGSWHDISGTQHSIGMTALYAAPLQDTALREAADDVLTFCVDVVDGWESLAPLRVRSAASESLLRLKAALGAK